MNIDPRHLTPGARQRLHQLAARSADGKFQTAAERQRERRVQSGTAAAAVAGTGAAVYGGKAAAAKVAAIGPDAIRRVRDTVKKLPLPGRRILTGGALISALKNLKP